MVPADQAKLDEVALDEEHTCIIRSTDPNAADNITTFNYEIQAFKTSTAVSQMTVHLDNTYA